MASHLVADGLLNKSMQDALAVCRSVGCLRACRYQLATIRPDGRPANRTVVHRGFLGESDRLLSISDTRRAAPE